MAITAAKLLVQVDADTDKAKSELKSFDQSMERLKKRGESLSSIGKVMTAGITLPIAAAGLASIKLASDVEESINKVNVVFGRSADEVQAFARSASTNLGMSRQAALEATGTFGNLFSAMGLGLDQAADMSTGLVQLASDLASFNNIDPGVALEKLRAGLVGEVEPLRTLGVNLSAAAVQAKVFEMGLTDTADAITPAMQAQARYAIILEQTTNAQGDFARTSDGLANSTRILKGQVADLGADLGGILLPYVRDAAKWAKEMLTQFQGLSPEMQKTIVAVGGLAAVAGPALIVIGNMAKGLAAIGSAAKLAGIGIAAVGGPITLIIAGLAALGTAIYMGIEDWNAYKKTMNGTGATAEESMNKLASAAGMMSLSTKGKIHDVEAAMGSLAAETKKAAEEQQKAAAEIVANFEKIKAAAMDEALQAGLSGNLTAAMDEYKQTLADLAPEQEKLQARLEYLNVAGWIPSAESVQKLAADLRAKNEAMTAGEASEQAQIMLLASHKSQLDEVKTALGENEAAQRAAQEAMAEATAQMIYQQAAAGLDATASLGLARAMGLISEQDFAMSTVLQNLRLQYDQNADGAITAGEGAAQYAANALQAYKAAELLQNQNLPITIGNIATALNDLNGIEQYDPGEFVPDGDSFATASKAVLNFKEGAVTNFGEVTTQAEVTAQDTKAAFETTDWNSLGATSAGEIATGFTTTSAGANGLLKATENLIVKVKKLWQDATWPGIGQVIAEGIAKGIEQNVGKVTSAVAGAVGSALSAGRQAARAESPSKLFADMLGKPISEGIGVGILQAAPVPIAATQAVIGATSQVTNQNYQNVSVAANVDRGIDMYELAITVANMLRG